MTVRLIVRTLSEICVTLGTLIVLFVVHVLFWTGVQADSAMDAEIERLQDRWAPASPAPENPGAPTAAEDDAQDSRNPDAGDAGDGQNTDGAPDTAGAEPPAPPAAYENGEAFAVMHIPRFGSGWAKPVLHGTAPSVLEKGLGHYTGTARLGERGNFAVAGHRRTHGDPFKDFPRLRPGDAVVLNDGTTWFTYRVVREPYRTLPSDTGVIAPVPESRGTRDVAGLGGPGRYLTLTTCEPEWGHSHRLIAWARLDGTRSVTHGKPSALQS